MAVTWPAKAPNSVIRYSWTVPLQDEDTLSSYTAAVSGAVIDDEGVDGADIVLYVSGGTAATTATFTLTALTANGETIEETIYLPIIASTAVFGHTAQDIVDFGLRPIVGMFRDPTDDQRADALEWLNGLLAEWKAQGADTGATLPLILTTPLEVPDEYILGIKAAARTLIAEQYGRQVSQSTMLQAARGLQLVKNANIPDEREQAVYY